MYQEQVSGPFFFSVVMFEVELMSFVDYSCADEFASFPEVCRL